VEPQQQQQQQQPETTRTPPSVYIECSPSTAGPNYGGEGEAGGGGDDVLYYSGYHSEEVDEDLEDLEEEQEEEDEDDDEVEEEEEEEEEEDQVDGQEEDEEEEDDGLPFPGFVPVTLGFMTQYSRPRSFCLRMITNPYPFLISEIVVVLIRFKLSRFKWRAPALLVVVIIISIDPDYGATSYSSCLCVRVTDGGQTWPTGERIRLTKVLTFSPF
jgi:hypothetical protein